MNEKSKGAYGGTRTEMSTLEVDTKFYVNNGHWYGEIIEINGEKHVKVTGEGGRHWNANGYELDITVNE